MPFDLAQALNFGLFVKAAYAVDAGDAPIYKPPAGSNVLTPLYANDLATVESPTTDYVPFGFVARNGSTLVVALRGTEGIFEWMDDVSFLTERAPLAGAGNTEDGFTDVYLSLRIDHDDAALTAALFVKANLQPGDSVVICGHSLGAAIATLLALDLALNVTPNVTLFTYASPNVGDGVFASAFAKAVPNTWRVVNPFDVVTHVPPTLLLGYEPVGETQQFNPMGQIELGIVCLHVMDSYLHLMSVALGQQPPEPLDADCVPPSR